MATKIKWTAKALLHLREIEDYIEDVDCSERAMSTVSKIMDAPEKLRNHPELGTIVPLFKKQGFREIRIFKWRILYSYVKEDQTVKIQAVWHGARRLRKEDILDTEH